MAKKPNIIEPITDGSFLDVAGAMVPKVKKPKRLSSLSAGNFEVVQYAVQGEADPVNFRLDTETESIWATQAQIALLFETGQSNVSQHLSKIFEEGELDEDNNIRNLNIDGSKKPTKSYAGIWVMA